MYNLEELYYYIMSLLFPIAGVIVFSVYVRVSVYIFENVLSEMAE